MVAGTLPMLQGLKDLAGENTPLLRIVNNLVGLMFVVLLAVPFHWVAFGPGERAFSSSIGLGVVSASSSGGETGGRLAFGIAAILMDLFILLILYRIIRGKDLSQGE